MKINRLSGKGFREELAQWWAGVQPLAHKMGPQYSILLVALAGLWIAGSHFSARYESLAPQVDLPRLNLAQYVNRGRDIPKEDNAADLYMQINGLLGTRKHWTSKSEEALRLGRSFEDSSCSKLNDADWQLLAAFAAETDRIIGQVREAQGRPQCVFALMFDTGGSGYYRAPESVGSCLAIRARVAAHFGDAAGWQQAVQDLLGFVETIQKDQTPAVAALQHRVLRSLLKSMEDACASGAAGDNAPLASLDGLLAAMRPMEAFEPMLSLAWSTMDFRQSFLYWNIYPRYFSAEVLSGKAIYDDIIDVPYRAGGFAARDRILSTGYLSGLLGILRSGQADAHVQAWKYISGYARFSEWLGREFAPRYNELSIDTPHIEWSGAPGTLYANEAIVRMARAVIVVMRQGRDEKGLFRDSEYLKGLLRDLPSPMTGAPIVCRTNSNRCELWYDMSLGRWVYREVCAIIETPSSARS